MKNLYAVSNQNLPQIKRIELTTSNFNMLKKELRLSGSLDSYLGCPAYYLLTARKGGYALKSGRQIVLVCQHPHEPGCQIIMPEVGPNNRYALTCEILRHETTPEQKFVLGKFSEEAAVTLSKQSGVRIKRIIDETMDWVFPTHIHSTRVVSESLGGKFMKVRNKVRLALKSGVLIQVPEKIDPEDIRRSVQKWLGERGDLAVVSDNYYSMLLELVRIHQSEFSGLVAFDREQQLAGIIVWRIATERHANIYAHLASREINGLSDLLMWKAASHLHKQGIEYMNVGGSESKKLDDYKKKYNPAISLNQSSFAVVKNEQLMRVA